jgi:hypothetical protein
MKSASIVVSKFYQKNRLFDLNDPISNRDNCQICYYELKNLLAKNDIELNTSDVTPPESADYIIYNDYPDQAIVKNSGSQKLFLIAMESPAIKPKNFIESNHKKFDKVFTWNDRFVNNENILKVNYSFDLPKKINNQINKTKLVCLINNNKRSNIIGELYTYRKHLINWIEQNCPECFSLYGQDWDFPLSGTIGGAILKKLKIDPLVRAQKYSSWRGEAVSKKTPLMEHKFNLCIENFSTPGYITEKIFDCFMYGCVPLYFGATNIDDYIPTDLFINIRDFESHSDLFEHISSMRDAEYQKYLSSAKQYLESDLCLQFSGKVFAKTIVGAMLT